MGKKKKDWGDVVFERLGEIAHEVGWMESEVDTALQSMARHARRFVEVACKDVMLYYGEVSPDPSWVAPPDISPEDLQKTTVEIKKPTAEEIANEIRSRYNLPTEQTIEITPERLHNSIAAAVKGDKKGDDGRKAGKN